MNAFAGPRSATSINQDYLVPERDLTGWSAGVFIRDRERDVRLEDFAFDTALQEDRVMGYVGYQLFSWVTAYIYGGQNDTELGASSDSGSAMGGALEFNLLTHLIKDPGLDEDRVRAHAGVSYTSAEADSGLATLDYNELEFDLTLSLINEVEGNKDYLPQAIGLSLGGLLSTLQGDIEDAGDSAGFKFGMDFLWTEHITIYAGIETLDESGLFAGVNLMF